MNNSKHLFFLMNHVFIGFAISILYGIGAGAVTFLLQGLPTTVNFFDSFFISFNCAISGGFILSTAILIAKTQHEIPNLIDNTFSADALNSTEYPEQRRRYLSRGRSIEFFSEFVLVGFVIFYISKFPFDGIAHYALLFCGCVQYGLGVYIGRKLFYIAQMLNSIEQLDINIEIFSNDRLGVVPAYVNSISTLTMIFVFVHVYSFYNAPFLFDTPVKDSLKIFLLLPAGIAAPVIAIFNFYPRAVIRSLYARSISREIERIKEQLKDSEVTEYERLSYLIEYDKMTNDELKYRMRVTLSDLPVAITIILMVVSLIFKG